MTDRETLGARWLRLAEADPDATAIVHWVAGEEPLRWTRAALLDAALAYAALLRERGVRRGDVCATVIRHHPQFYPLYLGVSLLGALPAVLAYPNPRLHPMKFRDGLIGMSQRSGLDWLLAERALEPVVRPLFDGGRRTIALGSSPSRWRGWSSRCRRRFRTASSRSPSTRRSGCSTRCARSRPDNAS